MDDIEKLRELLKVEKKQKPDVNEKYELFPERGDDGFVQRIGNPTYALQLEVDKVRVKSKTLPEQVRVSICEEYGWALEEATLSRHEYYDQMLSLCVLGGAEAKDDFSTMEADRLIKDFLMCTYF
ncbi:MAG: hypothetical protein RIE52_11860 [Balneola sp.]